METSSDKIYNVAFWESSLWCVKSSHRVTPFFSWRSLVALFLGNLSGNILDQIEARWQRKYPQKILERSFMWYFLWCVNSSNRVTRFFSWSCLLTMFSQICNRIIGSVLKPVVTNEISSDQNQNETVWESSLWCVHSSHGVKPFLSFRSLLTLFSFILQRIIWERMEEYGEKGIILRLKLETS